MKWLAVSSVLLVTILGLCLIPQANATPVTYNTSTLSFVWNTQARTSLTSDIFTEPGYNGTITGWFHIVNGSTTVSKILGSGAASVTIQCNYNINNGGVGTRTIVSNDTNLYYACGSGAGPYPFYKTDINTGTSTIRGHVLNVGGGFTSLKSFVGANNIYAITYQIGAFPSKFASVGVANFSIGSTGASTGLTNQKFFNDKQFTFNTVLPATNATTTNACEIKYMPTNATIAIDSIACDSGIPNHSDHFWYGMKPDRVGNYVTNSTYPMIQSIYSSQYQDMLTLPDYILGITGPDVRFILHNGVTDYMVVMTSSNIYYATTSSITSALSGYALQTYLITTTGTSSNYEVPATLLQNAQLYGPAGLNQTISAYGVMTIPSGYTLRLSTYSQATIRTLDPQWTNDNTLYPAIRTGTSSLFPVILTVNNAPTDASLIFTNPTVNLAYTYEPNLVFWLSPSTNTLDYISRTPSDTTQPTQIQASWGSYGKNFTNTNYLQYQQTGNILNFNATNAFSISTSVYPYSTVSAFDMIAAKGTDLTTTPGYYLQYLPATQQVRMRLMDVLGNAFEVTSSVNSVPLNTYTNVVFTYDGSSNRSGMKFYINGVLDSTGTASAITHRITNTVPFTIGSTNTPNRFFDGRIVDLKVYNTALSLANTVTLSSHGQVNPITETFGSTGEIWTVTRLDSTRTAEFDIPLGTCGNVYVADNSQYPLIYTYEGNICATGSNIKTISYTNTLPLNFWNLPYGVTHNFIPATNGLTTYFHTTTSPVTYKVLIKNSTGAITQNASFTLAANSTLDTRNFNTTNATKPAGLFVYVGSSLIYSAYMGSPLSLASIASFFNTYLSYGGFSLLSFIPIIFAAMFTRNTVGIGVVLTVLCIATLSWLSIVVIPDAYIGVMMLIAVIGLIAYRIYYG